MSLRRAMMFTLGNAAPVAALTLDLSGLSVAPYAWLGMSDSTGMVLSGSDFVSKPNKGTLSANWVSSNGIGSTMPQFEVDEATGHNKLAFNAHGQKVQLGTAADWKFLHDGTQYLVAVVAATNGNGGMLYSTVPIDVSGIGVFLFAGFFGSNWQDSLIQAFKNPTMIFGGTENGTNAMPPATFRLVTAQMRGYGVSSGNKWEAFVNGNASPYSGTNGGNTNNTLDSHLSGVTGTDPYQPLTLHHFGDTETSTKGLYIMELVIVPYFGGATDAQIVADRAYLKTQINAFYNLY